MLRKLLTCLALLTGLAAGHAPVRAEAAVALAAATEARAAAVSLAVAEPAAISAPSQRDELKGADRPLAPASAPATVAVHLGSDRARE